MMKDWNAFWAGFFLGMAALAVVLMGVIGIDGSAAKRECSKWNNGVECEYVLQPKGEKT